MKKLTRIVCFIVFLLGNILFGQEVETRKIELNWGQESVSQVVESFSISMEMVESGYVDDNSLPAYSEVWEVKNGAEVIDFTVKNVVFGGVYQGEISSSQKEKIPADIKVELKITNQNTKTVAVINLIPLVKEANFVKKVTSFEIEYQFSALKKKQTNKLSVKNSVLATGEWYKFSIDTTGIFKIDKDFLNSLGMNLNGIDPRNIQIYGNGGRMLPFKNNEFRQDGLQQNAIYVDGEDDGVFDNGDYVLFYGKGPHHWINSENDLSKLEHQFNIFSEEAFYFVTIGNSQGLRIQNRLPVETSATQIVENFDDYTFFEKDEVNLFAAGQQWFGDSFSIESTHSYIIPFNDIDTAENIEVRVRGVAESSLASSMDVKVNRANLFNVYYPANGGLTDAYANRNSGTVSASGNSVNVEVTYNNAGNPSANAFLDYIEVLGKKKLVANGNQFSFRNFEVIKTNDAFEMVVAGATNIDQIWDVSSPLRPKIVANETESASFTFLVQGGQHHEFIVVNENDFYSPNKLQESKVGNQNLHILSDLDYIIITRDYLKSTAQKLADYHIEKSDLKVAVIDLDQIYNEFSSGSPDLTAIRDFARHLYTNATTNQLKYICLFGDASYDYKDRIGGNNNVVPVFEAYSSFNLASSYVTDDYYAMMDEDEGGMSYFDQLDIATGRIPVTDALQAEEVVNKILTYYSSESFGGWRNHVTLVADDIDAAGEETIQVNMEKLADTISANKPLFNIKKIYADAYVQETSSGGQRYPTVNIDIGNQVEKGTLLMDYFGHGGEDGWALERILQVPEIQDFNNNINFPLFVTVTCEFTRFDNPLRKSAGEYLFWNADGGAGSLVSTTREIYISVGQSFNERFIKPLLNFNDENYTISEALMYVKNQFSTSQRFFIFNFGDPAMRLNVPDPDIRISKMNDIDVNTSLDTIKALSYTKFEGEVLNSSGNVLSDYNGELEVIIYDKPIPKKTLDNDNHNFVMEFEALESKIFTGRSKVENGRFTFDFIAPKDIKIAYGKGKLSFYATNYNIDNSGYDFNVVVGGINTDAPEDVIGPTVQMYMNDLNFVEGGNTNESPVFIVVLEDESGINTSITSVDHDIVAILDGDQSNAIILNDFYETELDDFTKGKVSYPFRNLEPGLHTITLKVWDTYNNVSEATFTFVVVDDSDLVLTNVLNYPNPFISYTEFWFNHNKPSQLLDVHIQIFTVSGKLVKTINETIQSEGNLSRTISWNGLDDFGKKIGKGVYVYKLKVSTVNSNISAEKIEKLVILQ